VLFANRVAHLVTVTRSIEEHFEEKIAKYVVNGELFFVSSNDLYSQFNYAEDPQNIVIDMYNSHLWDASTIAALDSITGKYEKYGKNVQVEGLNQASLKMRERLGGKLGGH